MNKKIFLLLFTTTLFFASDIFAQMNDINVAKGLFRKEEKKSDVTKRNYEGAIGVLVKLINANPNDAEAYYYLGLCYDRQAWQTDGSPTNVNQTKILQAVDYYSKCIKISPKYMGETYVLGPYARIITSLSALAFKFAYENETDSLMWCMQRIKSSGGMLPVIEEYGKNILNSCKKDAILFTYGDLDTYSLWYVQLVDNYRRDITVVNVTMLNTPFYAKMMKNRNPFGTANFPMRLPDKNIDMQMPISFDTHIEQLPVDDALIKEFNITDTAVINNKAISWKMEAYYQNTNQPMLRVQEVFTRDAILANGFKRPVYFRTTTPRDSRIGLNDYLRIEGMNYRLVPVKADSGSVFIEPNLLSNAINEDRTENSGDVVAPLYFNGLKNPSTFNDNSAEFILQNYRNLYSLLAFHYSNKKDTANAMRTLSKLNERFPVSLYPADYRFMGDLVLVYSRLGMKDKIAEIAPFVEKGANERMEKAPNDVQGAYNPYKILVDLYTATEQFDKAITVIQKLQKMYPDNLRWQQEIDRLIKLQNDKKK